MQFERSVRQLRAVFDKGHFNAFNGMYELKITEHLYQQLRESLESLSTSSIQLENAERMLRNPQLFHLAKDEKNPNSTTARVLQLWALERMVENLIDET